MAAAVPRRQPCPSCPYRRGAPSGIWAPEEYERLRRYDGDEVQQALAGAVGAFRCHQADGHLCSGWLGHRDPYGLLAVRIGVCAGTVDPVALDYTTTVPLFSSGAEAAEHGCLDLAMPGQQALLAMDKITRARAARGAPIVEE